MEKLVVIVLDDDAKAFKALEALRELDQVGEIALYDAQVVARQPDGSLKVISEFESPELKNVLGGTLVGILAGVLGGPAGMAFGGSVGLLMGAISELRADGVTDEFVKDVESALIAGKTAVLASISEDSTAALDLRVERLGGMMFRRIRIYEKERQEELDAAAYEAEVEHLRAERARAHADRVAKIDTKIDHLRARLQDAIERKRLSMRKREHERDVKVAALQAKADHSTAAIRQRHLDRIAELKHDYSEAGAGTPA